MSNEIKVEKIFKGSRWRIPTAYRYRWYLKNVGNQKGNNEKRTTWLFLIFQHSRLFAQSNLLSAISFNPVFNPSENHFHKDGLRANPSAEQPSKGRRKRMTNTTPMIIIITTRWKSCGQNGNPNILKRRSRTFNKMNWFCRGFLMNGDTKEWTKSR